MFKIGDLVTHINTGKRVFRIIGLCSSVDHFLVKEITNSYNHYNVYSFFTRNMRLIHNKQSNLPGWF
jgi:hypothetical protein